VRRGSDPDRGQRRAQFRDQPGKPDDSIVSAPRVGLQGSRLRCPRLRPAAQVDRRASPEALGRWRRDQAGKPGAAVPPASLHGPRTGLEVRPDWKRPVDIDQAGSAAGPLSLSARGEVGRPPLQRLSILIGILISAARLAQHV
jgi:hypothetical protein